MAFVYTYGVGPTGYTDGFTTQGWQPQAYAYGGRITFAEAGEVDQLGGYMRAANGTTATEKFALYDTSGNLVLNGSSVSFNNATATWVDGPTVTAASVSAADYVVLFSGSDRYVGEYGYDSANDGSFATEAHGTFPASTETITLEGDSGFGYGGRANFTAGGGTQYNQSVAGGITPAGALTKAVSKALAGAIAPTGAQNRSITKSFAGSIAPTGAQSRRTAKSFAGSITPTGVISPTLTFLRSVAGSIAPSGAVTKSVSKLVAGVVSTAGVVTKQTAKIVAGAFTPSGGQTRNTSKTVSGSISPSGVIATTLVVLRSVAGVFASSGTITKHTNKNVAGEVSPTGTATKQTGKRVSGGTTPSGSISRSTNKQVEGSVTPEGDTSTGVSLQQAVAGVISVITGALNAVKLLPPVITSAGTKVRRLLGNFYNRRQ